ncbi:MAG: hypothetical protein LBU12_08370, partial [Deltaproteobacteria bacterium]|nr:hypothetical protein [Deltaproteobacteria bacterium]
MTLNISSHNQDLLLKALCQIDLETLIEALHINVGSSPTKVKYSPMFTEMPSVWADIKISDFIFEKVDSNEYYINEFESSANYGYLSRFFSYVDRLQRYLLEKNKKIPILHFTVIYTGGNRSAKKIYNIGCAKFEVDQIFLKKRNGDYIYQKV